MKKIIALVLVVCCIALISCDSTGTSSSNRKKLCDSCGKYVSTLITRRDAAGVNRTWCSGCWADYDDIMGY